jgi:exosome complex exonuclease DIS3/RRP44
MEYEDTGSDVDDDNDDDLNHESSIVAAPSLYLRPAYFRQTRKGKIVKNLSERYLRDDLGLGCYYVDEDSNKKTRRVKEATNAVPRTIEDVSQLLTLLKPCDSNAVVVCDTNVLLHNLDVLEQSSQVMPNLVFPQTALVECRANRRVAYDRSVELMRQVGGERFCIFFPDLHHSQTAYVEEEENDVINDENDARIRNVSALLGEQLRHSNYKVILLTDDKGSRDKASTCSDYAARSVRDWVQELDQLHPGSSLSDLVAQHGGPNATTTGTTAKDIFPHHVGQSDLSLGVKTGRYYRGVLRSKDPNSAFVTIRRGDERVAVTIDGSQDRNRAIDGDVVAIELHSLDKWLSSSIATETEKKDATSSDAQKTSAGIASDTAEPSLNELSNEPDTIIVDDAAKSLRPTGKVVGILRRNFASYSGSIFDKPSSSSSELTERERIALDNEREHPDGTTTCVFFPVDTKVPPILIRTSQREAFLGQRIVVAMDSWPSHSPHPLGHYVETIGPAGSKDVETKVLLQQFKIAHEPFSAAVLACLPPNDYKIEMVPDRMDLRHLPVLSIDPPGCKDIDDALHCIVLPNGNYQVGVSIADVTHYVSPGSAIDLEAANRSTSTYLVNKRLDMLPALLTTDLCSLKANVDRYAFSVLWEVTPEAEIVNVDFKKTVIHSIAALTYQQAQSFIDQPDNDDDDPKVGAVKRLASLARKFREKRIEAGALTLASPEVKFVLDSESLNPTDVQAYALLEANALVEEFMLLANITVAKKILRHYPTLSVLRRHPSPNRAMFEGLISKARCRGFEIDIETSKSLADSLDASTIESEPYFNKLLRILSTRCMSPAQYFCSGEYRPMDWHHYGLAAPVYTHFTSPIRRYVPMQMLARLLLKVSLTSSTTLTLYHFFVLDTLMSVFIACWQQPSM